MKRMIWNKPRAKVIRWLAFVALLFAIFPSVSAYGYYSSYMYIRLYNENKIWRQNLYFNYDSEQDLYYYDFWACSETAYFCVYDYKNFPFYKCYLTPKTSDFNLTPTEENRSVETTSIIKNDEASSYFKINLEGGHIYRFYYKYDANKPTVGVQLLDGSPELLLSSNSDLDPVKSAQLTFSSEQNCYLASLPALNAEPTLSPSAYTTSSSNGYPIVNVTAKVTRQVNNYARIILEFTGDVPTFSLDEVNDVSHSYPFWFEDGCAKTMLPEFKGKFRIRDYAHGLYYGATPPLKGYALTSDENYSIAPSDATYLTLKDCPEYNPANITLYSDDDFETLSSITAQFDTYSAVAEDIKVPVYPLYLSPETDDNFARKYANKPLYYLSAPVLNNGKITPEYQFDEQNGYYVLSNFPAYDSDYINDDGETVETKYSIVKYATPFSEPETMVELDYKGAKEYFPDGLLSYLVFSVNSDDSININNWSSRRAIPFVGFVGDKVKLHDSYTTPDGASSDDGGKEAWLLFNSDGNPVKDREGNVMYNTFWPPKNPIYFTLSDGAKTVDITSTSLTFSPEILAETSAYVEGQANNYLDQDVRTGAEWKADARFAAYVDNSDAGSQIDHSNPAATAARKGVLCLDDDRQYALSRAENVYLAGDMHLWTGWNGSNLNNRSQWGLSAGVDANISDSATIPLCKGEKDFSFSELTYFPYVDFFYDIEKPYDDSYSVLFFEQSPSGDASITAALNSDKSAASYLPSISGVDDDMVVTKVTVKAYNENNKLVADLLELQPEENPKASEFNQWIQSAATLTTNNYLQDPTIYNYGTYYYTLEVELQSDLTAEPLNLTAKSAEFRIANGPLSFVVEPYKVVYAKNSDNNIYVKWADRMLFSPDNQWVKRIYADSWGDSGEYTLYSNAICVSEYEGNLDEFLTNNAYATQLDPAFLGNKLPRERVLAYSYNGVAWYSPDNYLQDGRFLESASFIASDFDVNSRYYWYSLYELLKLHNENPDNEEYTEGVNEIPLCVDADNYTTKFYVKLSAPATDDDPEAEIVLESNEVSIKPTIPTPRFINGFCNPVGFYGNYYDLKPVFDGTNYTIWYSYWDSWYYDNFDSYEDAAAQYDTDVAASKEMTCSWSYEDSGETYTLGASHYYQVGYPVWLNMPYVMRGGRNDGSFLSLNNITVGINEHTSSSTGLFDNEVPIFDREFAYYNRMDFSKGFISYNPLELVDSPKTIQFRPYTYSYSVECGDDGNFHGTDVAKIDSPYADYATDNGETEWQLNPIKLNFKVPELDGNIHRGFLYEDGQYTPFLSVTGLKIAEEETSTVDDAVTGETLLELSNATANDYYLVKIESPGKTLFSQLLTGEEIYADEGVSFSTYGTPTTWYGEMYESGEFSDVTVKVIPLYLFFWMHPTLGFKMPEITAPKRVFTYVGADGGVMESYETEFGVIPGEAALIVDIPTDVSMVAEEGIGYAKAGKGFIEVNGRDVSIYNLAGSCVATGDGVHYLDPGVYLVRYSGKTAKLMVQ